MTRVRTVRMAISRPRSLHPRHPPSSSNRPFAHTITHLRMQSYQSRLRLCVYYRLAHYHPAILLYSNQLDLLDCKKLRQSLIIRLSSSSSSSSNRTRLRINTVSYHLIHPYLPLRHLSPLPSYHPHVRRRARFYRDSQFPR